MPPLRAALLAAFLRYCPGLRSRCRGAASRLQLAGPAKLRAASCNSGKRVWPLRHRSSSFVFEERTWCATGFLSTCTPLCICGSITFFCLDAAREAWSGALMNSQYSAAARFAAICACSQRAVLLLLMSDCTEKSNMSHALLLAPLGLEAQDHESSDDSHGSSSQRSHSRNSSVYTSPSRCMDQCSAYPCLSSCTCSLDFELKL
mmetsp:Transcript_49596/g.116015  ORF Transcript_49596/g.116015 Transcript_49596/m.116015 type:complete len:204 (+) Transcript_49596:653-1264(+)